MDIYTMNGNMIRKFPQDDGTIRIEMDFLFDSPYWSRMFSLFTYVIALSGRRRIDFVFANYTYTEIVLRASDLDAAAEETLIQTLLAIRDKANLLSAMSDDYRRNNAAGGVVETNTLELLRSYETMKPDCAELINNFAAAIDPCFIKDKVIP